MRDVLHPEVRKVLPYSMLFGMVVGVIAIFWFVAEPDPDAIHDHSGNL